MTPELEAWKEIAKDLVKGLAAGAVGAIAVALRRRRPHPPLSIAPAADEKEQPATRAEVQRLMSEVRAVQKQVDEHHWQLIQLRQNHESVLAAVEKVQEAVAEGLRSVTDRIDRLFERRA